MIGMKQALLTLFIIGSLCYFNVVLNPFVHDDVVFILQNPQVHSLDHIADVFTQSAFAPKSAVLANAYYRPLLDVVYRLEYWMFGDQPAGYHIVNIILHIINAILLLVLTLRLTQRRGLSWCAAMLFLIHPVQSEAVACISGISNLLFTFFLLSAFLLYVRASDRRHELALGKVAGTYGASLFLFGMALLFKEQAVVLPALLMFYEFCFPRVLVRGNVGWRLRLAGFLIVLGGYFLWRKVLIGGFATSFVENWGEFYLRLKAFPAIIMNHLQTVFVPLDLHYYRSYDILSPWIWSTLSFILLAVACILIWRILPRERQPFFVFGWAWFAVTILPTTSLVPLIHEYSWIAMFEHFLYLPLVGLAWSVLTTLDYFVDQWFGRHGGNIKKFLIVVGVIGGVVLTQAQTKMWAGEIPLFENAVKYQPKMGRLRLLLAQAYYAQGDYQQARREYQHARDIMAGYLSKIRDERVRPFYQGFLRDSLLGLAASYAAVGNWVDAQDQYKKVLILSSQDSGVENSLGMIAIRLEQWDTAMMCFERALKADMQNVAVLTNLGVCYIRVGQTDKAEEYFRRALEVDGSFAVARENLNQLLKQKALEKDTDD